MQPRIACVVSQPFAENSYLLWRDGEPRAVVVDPGFEPQAILTELGRRGLECVAILLTHGHVDHIAGNRALKRAFPDAPILIGAIDAPMLTDAGLNLSAQFGVPIVSPPADRLLLPGEPLTLAGLSFDVRLTPGHSPGHLVYYVAEAGWLIGGDVLFAGGVGRTDFPGGSFAQLKHAIETQIWPLPDETAVYPGHGEATTVGEEKRGNPYVGGG